MADQQVKTVPTTGNPEVDDVLDRARNFWDRFSKPILFVLIALLVVVGGWFIYKNYVVAPREAKASDAIFPAENIFDKMTQEGFTKDSINLVLNGTSDFSGVLKIANNYGSSASGNRAKFIAGVCYLNSKDYNNAIKYLSDFSAPKATQVQTTAYSLLGDAYSELKNVDQAASFYKKAAEVNPKDEFMTSEALYREGLYAEANGKTDDAIAIYEKIRDEYPKSNRAADMDKYLARLGVVK